MRTFRPKQQDYAELTDDGEEVLLLKNEAFQRFNVNLLGLGDIRQDSVAVDAIAAVFDLSGFTNFCRQIEPHLSVPLYLSEYLNWMINSLKKETVEREFQQGVSLYNDLPFLIKFMGDGLLVLWDTSKMGVIDRRNVIIAASAICDNYKRKFLPEIRQKVVDSPSLLRCGLARGTVYSVGDGNDFVGSCINMASRLQKLPGVSFAFNIRGFDLVNEEPGEFFVSQIAVRKVSIRGIGDNELVAIKAKELQNMVAADQKIFRAVR